MDSQIIWGDCSEILKDFPGKTFDAVITDPPYALAKRDYGVWTESEWKRLMMPVTMEFKRILKPYGSAVVIIQPNCTQLGSMSLWVWEYLLDVAKNWNLIQDVYWWNYTTIPCSQSIQGYAFRPGIKYCLWFGDKNCYKNQREIMWDVSESMLEKMKNRCFQDIRRIYPSGNSKNDYIVSETIKKNDFKVSPYNVFPLPNCNSTDSAGSHGHGAGTPIELLKKWICYLTPPNGLVLDPFAGSFTTALACLETGRRYVCIEKQEKYVEIGKERIANWYNKQVDNGKIDKIPDGIDRVRIESDGQLKLF